MTEKDLERIREILKSINIQVMMLEGCTNRMRITMDEEELESMRDSAKQYIDSLFSYCQELLKFKDKAGIKDG